MSPIGLIADSGSSAGGWVILAIIVIAIVAKLRSNAARSGGVGVTKATLSDVGRGPDGSLRCPNCGGQQFTAKRSVIGKVGLGVLAPKTQVRCVACGTIFKRG